MSSVHQDSDGVVEGTHDKEEKENDPVGRVDTRPAWSNQAEMRNNINVTII